MRKILNYISIIAILCTKDMNVGADDGTRPLGKQIAASARIVNEYIPKAYELKSEILRAINVNTEASGDGFTWKHSIDNNSKKDKNHAITDESLASKLEDMVNHSLSTASVTKARPASISIATTIELDDILVPIPEEPITIFTLLEPSLIKLKDGLNKSNLDVSSNGKYLEYSLRSNQVSIHEQIRLFSKPNGSGSEHVSLIRIAWIIENANKKSLIGDFLKTEMLVKWNGSKWILK